jgi:hypothetical protein
MLTIQQGGKSVSNLRIEYIYYAAKIAYKMQSKPKNMDGKKIQNICS